MSYLQLPVVRMFISSVIAKQYRCVMLGKNTNADE